MELFTFVLSVFTISLSGAMSPGPVSSIAISLGRKKWYAGTLIAVGHGLLEFPLMILIVLGLDRLFKWNIFQIGVGIIGGIVLFLLGLQMLKEINAGVRTSTEKHGNRPIFTGFILSVSNPYFLLWWATVGLAMAVRAQQLGAWAFVLFAVTHWLCDSCWLTILSAASYKGMSLMNEKSQKIILSICAAAMLLFALIFILNSSRSLLKLIAQ